MKIQKKRGNEIVRYRTETFFVIVVKLYYHWSKSTFPSRVLTVKKIHPKGSLPAAKLYPCRIFDLALLDCADDSLGLPLLHLCQGAGIKREFKNKIYLSN